MNGQTGTQDIVDYHPCGLLSQRASKGGEAPGLWDAQKIVRILPCTRQLVSLIMFYSISLLRTCGIATCMAAARVSHYQQ